MNRLNRYTFLLFLFEIMQVWLFATEFIKFPAAQTVIGSNEICFREIGTNRIYYQVEEHNVFLDEYEIATFLVTNKEYEKFLEETGFQDALIRAKDKDVPKYPSMSNREMRKAPVTRCSGFDAIAYSQWYSEKNGDGVYRLPTSAEWENAAVTPNRYKYPWGNENKILKSLRTSDRVDRCRFPIDFVKEDVAESGIRNTYGGLELVLDTYVFADEKYKNLQSENPLIMDNYINVISSRGSIDDYNDLYNESGRFFPYMGDFEYPSPTSFRLVKDVGTVFNKNDIDECFYFINRGITDSDIVDVFEHPNEASSILISTKCKDFFILFKSTTNSAFYKVCFVDKIENDKDSWYYGWMRESDIELTNKKWYEK